MKTQCTVLTFATAVTLCGVSPCQQTGNLKTSVRDSYKPQFSLELRAITLRNEKTGEDEPAVALHVENITDPNEIKELPFPETQLEVTLNGVEPPTTLYQRQMTYRMRPGEPDLRRGGFEPLIAPDHSFTRKFRLVGFYDMSQSGTYKVQITAVDVQGNEGHPLKSNVVQVVVP